MAGLKTAVTAALLLVVVVVVSAVGKYALWDEVLIPWRSVVQWVCRNFCVEN